MLLLDKYRPKNSGEIFGQSYALNELRKCVNSRTPAILVGKTGVGKTSSVYALANEMNYEVVESNSSDVRNKEEIQRFLGNASSQMSLFQKGKIVLIEEIDGLMGRYDRGGVNAIIDVIKKSGFPIILTANDAWNKNFSAVKKLCKVINFETLGYTTIFAILKDISEKEGLGIQDSLLKSLAIRSNGDARAALIDLELFRYGNFNNIDFVSRDITNEISNVLRVLFKSKNPNDLFSVFDSLHEDMDEIGLWLEENAPKEYSGRDLSNCFDYLSKSDVYRGRITKRQYYRFLVYRRVFMSAGVGLSKEEKKNGHINYSRNSRILKMWIWNNKNSKKKSISNKIAKYAHLSTRRIMKDFYFYGSFLKNEDFVKTIGLNEDEMEWVRNH